MEGERETGSRMFLFEPGTVGGPLEELKATLEKKLLRCENLGEADNAASYRQAYELARGKLQSILEASKAKSEDPC